MAANFLSDHAAPNFDDPLGLLSACHRRIERQLETLARLQRHLPEYGCDADARAAARGILRYFDTAAPNHHADEEASTFPRLKAALPGRIENLIADLEGDHTRLAIHWRKLRPLLAAIAGGQRANLSAKQVADVTAAYDAHIAREENELIPLAAQVFDAAALAEIGKEMAARRGVSAAERALTPIPVPPLRSIR
jgi:hemerythrin-like domain-containing protein